MRRAFLLLAAALPSLAQSPGNVLVVVNDASLLSRRIAEYYVHKRSVPLVNICHVKVPSDETISRETYEKEIENPIADYLIGHGLRESILYMATTLGLPLRVSGSGASPMSTTACAVDSELTLLYAKLGGTKFQQEGMVPNPFFGKRDTPFQHPQVPIYLVTRLAGYDFEDVKGIIDRSLAAENRGKFVIDLKSSGNEQGNDWLREAAKRLPADRVVLDQSDKVLYGERDAIAYAGWGSNDPNRHQRFLGFHWLPGAIAIEFVSTDARTFQRPPDSWNISTWKDTGLYFAGAPQTLTADYIHEGATGCSGHVDEPYLIATPRPEFVLPAYYAGRNLAESYYLGIRGLSWQNIVVGDPLCRLSLPAR
jgi:uncharacterized protein (TIGR03790 family)